MLVKRFQVFFGEGFYEVDNLVKLADNLKALKGLKYGGFVMSAV